MLSFRCMIIALLVAVGMLSNVDAFGITAQTSAIDIATPLQTLATTTAVTSAQHFQPISSGIRTYMNEANVLSSSSSSSSIMMSLQERKIPTKEEIDQKKLTFNVIFWGGGFVAPFIATVFYFGFRFWEK